MNHETAGFLGVWSETHVNDQILRQQEFFHFSNVYLNIPNEGNNQMLGIIQAKMKSRLPRVPTHIFY